MAMLNNQRVHGFTVHVVICFFVDLFGTPISDFGLFHMG